MDYLFCGQELESDRAGRLVADLLDGFGAGPRRPTKTRTAIMTRMSIIQRWPRGHRGLPLGLLASRLRREGREGGRGARRPSGRCRSPSPPIERRPVERTVEVVGTLQGWEE